MEVFVWWTVQMAGRVVWRCVAWRSGEQSVMTSGTLLMLMSLAFSWDIADKVANNYICSRKLHFTNLSPGSRQKVVQNAANF